MGFRFIEKKKAGFVAKEEAETDGMDELVFAVGKGLDKELLFDSCLFEGALFESHNAFMRSGRRNGLVDVETGRFVDLPFGDRIDFVNVESEKSLEGLEEVEG
jgi:hypothetical protein